MRQASSAFEIGTIHFLYYVLRRCILSKGLRLHGFTPPSRESSPIIIQSDINFLSINPIFDKSPTAMGRSNAGPSFWCLPAQDLLLCVSEAVHIRNFYGCTYSLF